MLLFTIGYGLVQVLIVAIAIVANRGAGQLPHGSLAMLLLALLVVPTGAAWFSASLVNGVRPRRLFDARARRPLARVVLGLASAAAALAPMTLAVAVLADYLPDAAATGVCAATTSALCVLLLPRRRPGFCVHCGYDLHALPENAVCPECGAMGSG